MFRVHQFDKVEMFVVHRTESAHDEHEHLLEIERVQGARSPLPRRQRRGRRPRRVGGEEVRHRGLVPGPGAVPGADLDLQHDRLPVATPGDPHAPRRQARARRTLNGTAVTARTMIALMENFQGEVPDVCGYGAPDASLLRATPSRAASARASATPPRRVAQLVAVGRSSWDAHEHRRVAVRVRRREVDAARVQRSSSFTPRSATRKASTSSSRSRSPGRRRPAGGCGGSRTSSRAPCRRAGRPRLLRRLGHGERQPVESSSVATAATLDAAAGCGASNGAVETVEPRRLREFDLTPAALDLNCGVPGGES